MVAAARFNPLPNQPKSPETRQLGFANLLDYSGRPMDASQVKSDQPSRTQGPERPSAGDRLDLTLTAWGRLGEAMAEHEGQNVFVFGGIPGEHVVAEVVRVHRKYLSARVIEVVERSPDRTEPECPYFGPCTGCQWQHLDYRAQLEAKRDKVLDALVRVGGLEAPTVPAVAPSPDRLGYRNHARFTVNRGGELGFVNRETRRFVRVDNCLLMHRGVNALLTELQDRCQETTQLSIRAGKHSGDALVQPKLLNPAIAVPTGQKRYVERVDGHDFFVSSPSFFQVNVEQAAFAAETVRHHLALGPTDLLVDAYAGVGAFAVLLAPWVERVIAIEESAAAVADARENSAGLDNLEFLTGRTEEILGGLHRKPDAVILDPPRAGCQEGALAALVDIQAPRVAYVSCDPETLARDLRVLVRGGYSLEQVIPIDMFPQTHHVECVAVLRWAGAPTPLVLASASPRRREIMGSLRLDFEVQPADVPEDPLAGETPVAMVERLSRDKALKVAGSWDAGFVVGADSTVAHLGESVGKPLDDDDARLMLRRLRNTTHHVATGLTVVNAATGQSVTGSMISEITLRYITDDEIEESIASGTPRDKAGAYAVQDPALRPASSWEGCYSNIVGLPVCRLLEMLDELGYRRPADWVIPAPAVCNSTCPLAGTGAAPREAAP